MALTTAEESRVQAIERALNRISTAIKNLAPREDLNRYSTVRQREIEALTTRVTALEQQVRLLQTR